MAKTKEQLAKDWAKIPEIVRKKMTRAVKTNAKELQKAIAIVAPKDTGGLKASVLNLDISADSGFAKSVVKTEQPYAKFVEFGTERMSAEPFFFTTYRALRGKLRKRNRSALKRGIKEALKNG